MIKNKFFKHLTNIILPTKEQEIKERWNVSGVLNKHSNQHLKFDTRPMFSMENNQFGKEGTTASKADKMVFETKKEWIIIDIIELNEYVRKQSSKIIQLEDLIKKLEWNIYISKV
jgi:hypothetical protein